MSRWFFKCRIILIFPILGGCISLTVNDDVNISEPDTGNILKSFFGNEVEYRTSKHTNTLLYCPDNTCNEFSVPDKNDFLVLNDFVYLLFVYATLANYPKMVEFKKHQSASVVDKVLRRNSKGCVIDGDKNSTDFIKCVILKTQQRAGIQPLFVRYDENGRHEVKMDIEELLQIRG